MDRAGTVLGDRDGGSHVSIAARDLFLGSFSTSRMLREFDGETVIRQSFAIRSVNPDYATTRCHGHLSPLRDTHHIFTRCSGLHVEAGMRPWCRCSHNQVRDIAAQCDNPFATLREVGMDSSKRLTVPIQFRGPPVGRFSKADL
jgi:hypothetical protein